ncbi:MAG: flavodoxin domain-containing protein [Candidatus Thorarchaeota archaeon]
MNDNVLICYGTRYGSAGEIAEKIGEILRNRGATVEVVNLKKDKVRDLQSYDLVVVGSGIQMGRWTKEPLKFLKKNREFLSRKKVALFVSCMSATKPETSEQGRTDYLDKIIAEFPEIVPISMGFFGGFIDPIRGSRMTKGLMKALLKEFAEEGEEPPEYVDLRDWDQIRIWAEGLSPDPFDA